jgi:hypothetical protein
MSKKNEWKKEEPKILSQLEGILFQTSWLMEQELKKQEKKLKQVQTVLEQNVRNEAEWRVGKQ